jgi:competence protein ComEC
MPDELYEAYRRSGTLHLLAVSGSNVWLVLGVFWLLFRTLRFHRVVQIVLLLGILVVFCFVTRNDPSVVRAGVMAALVLIGLLFHRRIDMLNIIGASAVIILLFSPRHLFLAGFQLSYAAVIGILILVPRILQLFPGLTRWRAGRWGLTLAGSSVAATVATAPILALHFGVIPAISVIANLFMVPLA